ncbi:MAG: deoxyribonuclease IV [Desulfobacterota bacterium]|nr:deoxyribonuclease IV [Thermodesulfobacteriota bacterium]
MRFGFHVSIAGGLEAAVHRAQKIGCRTLQLFSRNPRGWQSKPFDRRAAQRFRQLTLQYDIRPVFVHLPYLPNLAAADEDLYERSVRVLCDDLWRAEQLGAAGLVLHLGHRNSALPERALLQVAHAINKACTKVESTPLLLLENAAGQGSEVGSSFSELQEIMDLVSYPERIGLCLDTAHAFAAGYNVRTAKGLATMLDEIERRIGLQRLRLIHLNDAKAPCGSRIDRHWHIGKGCIGTTGMRRIISHPLLTTLPAIMETPKKGENDDVENMKAVLRLARGIFH